MTDLLLRQTGIDAPAPMAVAEVPLGRVAGHPIAWTLIDTRAAIETLADDWNGLFARAGRPEQVFQTFAWCRHWVRHYLTPRGPRLAVVTGRIDGRLVLVLPLVIERRAGLRQLAWLGEPVSQYGDVLAAPEAQSLAAQAEAWRFAVAATRADLANLRKVRADAMVGPLLEHIGASVTATEEAPYLDFRRAPDLASFEAGLPSKSRLKNRRRQLRRLAERGPVSFEQHASGAEAAALADYAILLKRTWLNSRDRISLALADRRFQAFFADVAGSNDAMLGCQLLALRTCNEIAALKIIVECKGQRFLHVAVYAGKFEKTGAGALLLENALAGCYRDGIGRLDLLPPRHDYKMDFADAAVLVRDHAVALSLAGQAYVRGYLQLRRRIKAAVETAPAPARRLIAGTLALARRGRA